MGHCWESAMTQASVSLGLKIKVKGPVSVLPADKKYLFSLRWNKMEFFQVSRKFLAQFSRPSITF